MRVVEFVDGRRLRSQPVHVNLVKAHCHNMTHVKFSCAEVCTPKLWALLKTNPHIECLHSTMSNGDEDSFDRSFDNIVLPNLKHVGGDTLRSLQQEYLGCHEGDGCSSVGSIFL